MQNGVAAGLRGYVDGLARGDAQPPPIAQTIGMTDFALDDAGVATFEMDADLTRHANPMGTVHGGVLTTLADSAMGMAYAAQLREGETFTTLELKINFMRPVWK